MTAVVEIEKNFHQDYYCSCLTSWLNSSGLDATLAILENPKKQVMIEENGCVRQEKG